MLTRLAGWAAGAAGLERLGRTCSAVVLVQVGDAAFRVTVHRGRVESVERGAGPMPSYTFALRAPAAEWARFWLPVPPPGSNDLLALRRRGVLAIEGDVRVFMAHLRYFKALLALPRGKEVAP